MENDTDNAFYELTQYPLPLHTINYQSRQVGNNNRTMRANIHDTIYLNMQELIPNIELGLFQNKTNEQIEEWIEKTKQYNLSIFNHFSLY